MTEKTETLTDAQRTEIEQQILHATRVMFDATKTLNDMGVSAPAIATACATTFVNFVGAMAFTLGLDKKLVLESCKDAIDSMEAFVDDLYEGLDKQLAEATEATEAAQKDAA